MQIYGYVRRKQIPFQVVQLHMTQTIPRSFADFVVYIPKSSWYFFLIPCGHRHPVNDYSSAALKFCAPYDVRSISVIKVKCW